MRKNVIKQRTISILILSIPARAACQSDTLAMFGRELRICTFRPALPCLGGSNIQTAAIERKSETESTSRGRLSAGPADGPCRRQ